MEIEPPGLGVSWLWKLPESHPFTPAGIKHDLAYDTMLEPTSKKADDEFLKDCLKIAGNDLKLKAQAYLFYYIIRIWGFFRWQQKK